MEARRVVAIHQPNFFPWLGYFNKIACADVFVLMDNAQFSKTGGTWSNRVKLLVAGEARWVTAPAIRSYHGVRRINEIEFNALIPWREKMGKTLETNYSRALFFRDIFPVLSGLIGNSTDHLSEYNVAAITVLINLLGLNASKLVLGSTLNVEGHATDLLIAMTKAAGGTAYLCGGGAEKYQEDIRFAEKGLELIYQSYQHPAYPQINTKTFVPGLSIIDVLMNCGIEGTRKLLGIQH